MALGLPLPAPAEQTQRAEAGWRRVGMQLGQTAKRRLGQKRQSSERRGNLERDRQRGLLHLDYAYFVVSNHIE